MSAVSKDKSWAYKRKYYLKNKHFLHAKNSERVRKARLELISEFGGRCTYCGERDPVVLDFDHIDDGGTKHRKQHNGTIWLVKKYPK